VFVKIDYVIQKRLSTQLIIFGRHVAVEFTYFKKNIQSIVLTVCYYQKTNNTLQMMIMFFLALASSSQTSSNKRQFKQDGDDSGNYSILCGKLRQYGGCDSSFSSLQQFPSGLDHCYDWLGLVMVPPYIISEHLMQFRVLGGFSKSKRGFFT
jgi:hypothetical protein